jgi:hypothetical protein
MVLLTPELFPRLGRLAGTQPSFFSEEYTHMPKMIALKAFRYPRNINGTDHQPGDEVEVINDRDAKALRLLKLAKDPPGPAEEPAAPKVEAVHSEATAETHRRRGYKRADMTAETPSEE